MAFPVSPTNGQVTVVNQVSYQYSSATNSWTRILSTANVITANTIAVNGALTVGTTISAVGNITAGSGNFFIGNGSQLTGVTATSAGFPIVAGNSNIAATASANIYISVAGTSNVAVFATTGEYITGVLSASGTITGGNLATGGTASAAGNVTGGNILTGGLISATSTITSAANVTGGNVLTGGLVSATGNVTGGNILTAGDIVNAPANTLISMGTGSGIIGITSNANTTQFLPSGQINLGGVSQVKGGTFTGSYLTLGTSQTDLAQDRGGNVTVQLGTGGTIANTWTFAQSGAFLAPGAVSAVGNVTGGNVLTAGLISATSTITSAANITGGNLLTAGLVSATGNVTGNYILGNGALLTGVITSVANINNGTSNVTVVSSGGNVTVGIGGTANVAVFATTGEYITGELSASGNVTGGNVLTGGLISATSSITSAANITGGNLLTGGLISATSTITSAANITGGNVLTGGLVSATANVTGGNLLTGGLASIAGDVTGGNVLTAGLISATGNITGGNVNTNQLRNVSGNLTVGVTSGNLLLQPSGNVVLSANTYINNLAYPFASSDAATKEYVDNFATTAISYHQAVNVATTTTLATTTGGTITYAQPNGVANGIGATLTTTGTFDLIDTANVQTVGTRILVKNEANAVFNGIYTWSNATVIVRSTDADQYGANSSEELSINDYFFIQSGSVNAGAAYIVDAPTGTITFGTSNIAFAQFSSSQTYTANTAAGISLNGTVINAKTDGVTTAFDGGGNIIVKASANLTTPNIGAATGTSLSTTANIQGGNLLTGGLISATSTITSAANITGGNVLTGGLVSATANVTGGNLLTAGLISATSTITSAANITGGNLLTAGLISATSTITSAANITGGNVLTGGLISATSTITSAANITGGNVLTGGLISATSTITSAANITGGNVLTAGLVSATGNVTGNYILGNGALLTGVITSVANINNGTSNVTVVSSGGNVTVGVGGTGNVAVFATTGEYITGELSASGNVTGGNLLTAGLISATSTITSAANITGGNVLTGGLVSATANVTGGNLLTAGIISATGNIRGGNVSATNYYYANSVAIINYTAATTPPASPSTGWQWYNTSTDVLYEYITDGTTPYWVDVSSPAFSNGPAGNMSIGGSLLPSANVTYDLGSTTNRWKDLWLAGTTLYLGDAVLSASGTSVSLGTGNVTGGNVTTAGIVSATGNITGSYIFGNGSQLTGVDATQIINGTSNAKVSGSGGNIAVTIGGTANVGVFYTGGLSITGDLAVTGNATLSGNILGDRIQNGTTQIDIQSANGNANITVGGTANVAVFTTAGMTITGNIENGGSNGTGNIGSATTYFNTIFGKATTAQYADLAENYLGDAAYVPGTVLDFDGAQEVTLSTRDSSRRVAGVVSTNPAHLMNSTLDGAHVVAVALVGRVPTQVTGTIAKGDLMVSAGNGRARAEANPATGTVIGKALENFDGGEGTIEIVISMQ